MKAKSQQLDEVKSLEFSNLSERVEQIKHNSEKWKSRVGEELNQLTYQTAES